MSKTFYVILPSDTRDPPDNRTNKFTVRLPKTLNFNSMWLCGLSSIIYPHSYAAIGTTKDQYIYVLVNDGRFHWPYSLIRVKFPKGSFATPQALAKKLNLVVSEAADKLEAEWHKSPYYRGRQKRAVTEEVEQEIDDREDKPADKKSKPDAEIDDREDEQDEEDELEERRRRDKWAHIHTINGPGPHPIRYELYQDNKDQLIVPKYHGKTVNLSSKARKPTPAEIREQRLYMQSYTAPNGKLIEVYYNHKADIVHVSVKSKPPPAAPPPPSSSPPPGPTPHPPPPSSSPTPGPTPPPPPPPPPLKKEDKPDEVQPEIDDRDAQKKKPPSPASPPKKEEKSPAKPDEEEIDDRESEKKKVPSPPPPPPLSPKSDQEGPDVDDREAEKEAEKDKTRPTDFLLGHELERFGPGTVSVDFDAGVSESQRTDEVSYAIIYEVSKRTYMEQKHHHHHDILRRLRFEYDEEKQRYRIIFKHHSLEYCYFTPQLAYSLGYSEEDNYAGGALAAHPPDLGGGIHHLYVYAHNLTENIIVGDKMAALLRIVTIKGESGQMIEETFNTPIMSRVVNNDLNEIGIEIRTADGRLFPFEWGTVHLVLVFKKAIYL